MPYIAANPDAYVGKSVPDGQCVAYVKACAQTPSTSSWRAGIKVLGATQGDIVKGTVIATMVDGHYPNNSSGNHAAIYLSQDANGIQVLDQWIGQVVHYRTIRTAGGQGNPSNDAGAYYVVE